MTTIIHDELKVNDYIKSALESHQKEIQKLNAILLMLKETRVLMCDLFDDSNPKKGIADIDEDGFFTIIFEQMDKSMDVIADEQNAIIKIISDLCFNSIQDMLYPSN